MSYTLQAKGCILSKYNHTLLQEPRLTVCINNTFDKKIRMAINIPASPWPSEAFKLEMNDKEKKNKKARKGLDCSWVCCRNKIVVGKKEHSQRQHS